MFDPAAVLTGVSRLASKSPRLALSCLALVILGACSALAMSYAVQNPTAGSIILAIFASLIFAVWLVLLWALPKIPPR
jgi:hypothetical protein